MFKKLVHSAQKLTSSNSLIHDQLSAFSSLFRFEDKENISSLQQLKSSVQKGIRAKILETYPMLETHVDVILPKKDMYRIAKWFGCSSHSSLSNIMKLFSNPAFIHSSPSARITLNCFSMEPANRSSSGNVMEYGCQHYDSCISFPTL